MYDIPFFNQSLMAAFVFLRDNFYELLGIIFISCRCVILFIRKIIDMDLLNILS